MKIVIFGVGKIFNEYVRKIDFRDVVAIIDNCRDVQYRKIYGHSVIAPDRINEFDYDYVVIFNQGNSLTMAKQLEAEGVPSEKLISWQYYFFMLMERMDAYSLNSKSNLQYILKTFYVDKILDVNGGCIKNLMHIWQDSFFYTISKIDGLMLDGNLVGQYKYNTVLNSVDGITDRYDAAILLDYFVDHSVQEWMKLINKIKNHCRLIITTVPFPLPEERTEWNWIDFSSYGKVKTISCKEIKLIVIDQYNQAPDEDIKIFAITHKVFEPPFSGPCDYLPIWAGASSANAMGIQGDAEGESVAELNPLINEATAMYWIWKNTGYKYVGTAHYRRYMHLHFAWDNGEQALVDGDIAKRLLEKYDVLAIDPVAFDMNIKEQLRISLGEEAFDCGYNNVRQLVKELHPDYLDEFDQYFEGHYFYPCNMMITKKEVYDQYCEWLFSLIIPAARRIDITKFDEYSKRTVGFMAERLFTLWLLHNHKSVKELSV